MGSARCFKVNPADNVATMLDDVDVGAATVFGSSGSVQISEPIKLGHKVALCEIGVGEAIVKFGVPIGKATISIKTGEWVHLHNCTSFLDERSQTLDLHSGAATDTVYE